jgi:8-oxo-dGTP diphosphatase
MATRAKKISVGAVFTGGPGEILLVEPTYKRNWDLPGGILEANEDPLSGLRREVKEELGLPCEVGEILAVDYSPSDWEDAEVLMLTFAASFPMVSHPPRFTLDHSEIRDSRFVPVDTALTMVTDRMRDRLNVALGLQPPGPHGILVSRPHAASISEPG